MKRHVLATSGLLGIPDEDLEASCSSECPVKCTVRWETCVALAHSGWPDRARTSNQGDVGIGST